MGAGETARFFKPATTVTNTFLFCRPGCQSPVEADYSLPTAASQFPPINPIFASLNLQHHFKQVPGGVEMTDIVHYKVPYGFIGELVNRLWVRKQLDGIFSYRRQQVEKIFGVL